MNRKFGLLIIFTVVVSSFLSTKTAIVEAEAFDESNNLISVSDTYYNELLNSYNLVHKENFIFESTLDSKEYNLDSKDGLLSFITDNKEVTFETINLILEGVSNPRSFDISPFAIVPTDPPGGKWKWHVNVNWINRSDGWNLSAYLNVSARQSLANSNSAFAELKSYYSGKHSLWYNEASLKGQWTCHYYFANNKTYWNINPAIPNKNAFQWVVDRCN